MDTAKPSNRKLTFWLLLGVLGMFGFGFALIPLYDIMCEQLGINGKPNNEAVSSPVGMQVDTSRVIRVEFMAHVKPDMPWTFIPAKKVMDVHPGQVVQTRYMATNLNGSPLIGQAVPSIAPGNGAAYFNKIECFCFNRQPLEGNKSAELPVIFYIEPTIPDSIHTLTLSYTLFNITEPEDKKTVALISRSETDQGAVQ
ncbi:cytochrome c oxidase assembly protein [Vibrio penaeicida]|uniref:Cytochrome c oxidase assembly protein CtaG n=1 Tax=Vibrio penaeicida TaxID=104609 RepID=A0AAV5NYL1_9VIBR|nr:cytochrome c oxidase assembly protein [Vibrio penaeicida]RTZ23707.1 cytochrome c oxidase assembly protein [Vibrio penaeicida]GLQ75801.1 cytochrome c oxidase assembly protein [Vibrio penaeicida]